MMKPNLILMISFIGLVACTGNAKDGDTPGRAGADSGDTNTNTDADADTDTDTDADADADTDTDTDTDPPDTGDDPQIPSRWVGRSDVGDPAFALVIDDDIVLGYACGGETTYPTHTRWFTGAIDDTSFTLEKDGWEMTVDLTSTSGTGLLSGPDGESDAFSLNPVEPATFAGLYSGYASDCRTGGVLFHDSPDATPELQGVWCDEEANMAQVTPVDMLTPDEFDMIEVQAEYMGEIYIIEIMRL